MRYGMAIDLKRCLGCHACATACRLANNLPSGVWWNVVYTDGGETMDTASGTFPDNLHMQHYPTACQQCDNPPCVEVCPAGATWKDEETGIVMQDSAICIGCESCDSACPYGVRRLIKGEPKWAIDHALGYQSAPLHQANTMGKCVFCKNLLDEGQLPKCISACVGHARIFGDLDDPESDISKLIASNREVIRLQEEVGTEPKVLYVK